QATAEDLSEHGQVGQHAIALLRATARDPKARDHLVEDEQRAALVAKAPQALEEPRSRRDDAHVPGDRLDEDARRAVDRPLDPVEVVEVDDATLSPGLDPERPHSRAGLGQKRVGVAVVAAAEADERLAPGRRPRQTQ